MAPAKAPAKALTLAPAKAAAKSTGSAQQPTLFGFGVTKTIKTKNNTVYTVIDVAPPALKDKHVCPVCSKTCQKASGLATHMKTHEGFGPIPDSKFIADALFPSGRGSDAIFSFYKQDPPAHAPPPSSSGPGLTHARDHWRFYEGSCFVSETRRDGSTHLVLAGNGADRRADEMDTDSDSDAEAEASDEGGDGKAESKTDSKSSNAKGKDGRRNNRGSKRRKRETYDFKANVLTALSEARDKGLPAPQQVIAESAGISSGMLSKWEKQEVRSCVCCNLLHT